MYDILDIIPPALRPMPGRGTAFSFIVLPRKNVIFSAQTKAHWRQSFKIQREWKNATGGEDTWLESEKIAEFQEPRKKSKRWRNRTELLTLNSEDRAARYTILPHVYRSREGAESDRDRLIILECEDRQKGKKDWNDLVLFIRIS